MASLLPIFYCTEVLGYLGPLFYWFAQQARKCHPSLRLLQLWPIAVWSAVASADQLWLYSALLVLLLLHLLIFLLLLLWLTALLLLAFCSASGNVTAELLDQQWDHQQQEQQQHLMMDGPTEQPTTTGDTGTGSANGTSAGRAGAG